MTARNMDTIVTDKVLYEKAMHIREWLWKISGLIRRLNEDPNPCYGRTQDGLVLIEYYGGPSAIGTPLGQWACTGGGCHEKDWLEQAKERLGLVMIQEEIVNDQGCYGPVWGITKDLDGNALPEPKWKLHGLSAGFNCAGVFTVQSLMPVELRKRLTDAKVTCDHAPDWVYPVDWLPHQVYGDMLYYYHDYLWKQMKKQIGFVAWDDRIDPDYHLVPLYSLEDRVVEGKAMQHAIAHVPEKLARDGRFYSLRDKDGTRLLTLSTYYCRDERDDDWHWVCRHIVGYRNRPPTDDEIKLVEKLLAPRECYVNYAPNAIF